MGLRSFINQVWQVIYGFLPKSAQDIIDKGLVKAFALLVGGVVVLPVAIALLSALWLRALGSVDFKPAKAMHEFLVSIIQEGFAVEEVAARSHKRLDYLQLFEYDLLPQSVSLKELNLSLHARQRATIHFRTIEPVSRDQKCPLSPDAGYVPLVAITLGDQPVRVLNRVANETVEIGRKWWDANDEKIDSDDPRLVFRLTDQARRMPCGDIHIEGSVRVFKELLGVRR